MMNYIWAGMIIISFVVAVFTGNTEALSASIMEGAGDATQLIIGILGMMCLWSGMMEIANRSNLSLLISRAFSPILRLLFRDVPAQSKAFKYISLNISANLLGLSNAATPFGIAAMKELKKSNPTLHRATDSMVLFVVLNTASLQLLPTTLAVYRGQYGSANPFDILPCVWISSLASLVVAVVIAKVFSKGEDAKEVRLCQ